MAVLEAAEAAGNLTVVGSVAELVELAVPDGEVDARGEYIVGYDVPGRGFVPEARVSRVRNGVAANYIEPEMRRRDPDCMLIGDKEVTDKPTFSERFNQEFDPIRQETLEWLATQPITVFFFRNRHARAVHARRGDLPEQRGVLRAGAGDAPRHHPARKGQGRGKRLLP